MLTTDPAVLSWQIALAPRPRYEGPPRRNWWHELVTAAYRDARDAWEALRESEPYLQHELDDFLAEHPVPKFKDFLIGLSQGSIAPESILKEAA